MFKLLNKCLIGLTYLSLMACSIGISPPFQVVSNSPNQDVVVLKNSAECVGTDTVHDRFCSRKEQRADCTRHSICRWEKSGAVSPGTASAGECIGTDTIYDRSCEKNKKRSDCTSSPFCKWEKSGAVVIINQ